jgi:sortase A
VATSFRILIPAPSDEWGPLPPHATPKGGRRGWRWLERVLFVLAFVLLGYYGYVWAETRLYQAMENRELDAILASGPAPAASVEPGVEPGLDSGPPAEAAPAAPSTARRRRAPAPAPGDAVGRIEIPRLGVSTIIRAGSDARTLRLAVGHIPGTALPGGTGNIGLAGHRDTFFRQLRGIHPGDEIRVVTPDGTFTYRVQFTEIVWPKDTWVLDDTGKPALTLVTCYPFTYIGSAPQRFIVRAVELQEQRASL